jgi:hypothetical protein
MVGDPEAIHFDGLSANRPSGSGSDSEGEAALCLLMVAQSSPFGSLGGNRASLNNPRESPRPRARQSASAIVASAAIVVLADWVLPQSGWILIAVTLWSSIFDLFSVR